MSDTSEGLYRGRAFGLKWGLWRESWPPRENGKLSPFGFVIDWISTCYLHLCGGYTMNLAFCNQKIQ
jgi:hypothetical protein